MRDSEEKLKEQLNKVVKETINGTKIEFIVVRKRDQLR